MLMLEQSMQLRSIPISFLRGCRAFSKMMLRPRFLAAEQQGRHVIVKCIPRAERDVRQWMVQRSWRR